MGCLQATLQQLSVQSAVQLCSTLVMLYFHFAMTELVLISLAFHSLVPYDDKRSCNDAKQETQGMGHSNHGNIVL